MKDWRDIEVGATYRLRNLHGQELDRTIISVDEKMVRYQRAESEAECTIGTRRFIELHNQFGIPFIPGQYGDWVAAFIDPDFEFDDDDGQLALPIKEASA